MGDILLCWSVCGECPAWNECGIDPLPDERGRYPGQVVVEWAEEMSAAFHTMVRC